MGRVLALDYGTRRTGVAVSDPSGVVTVHGETVPTVQLMDFLKKYLAGNDVSVIVVGMPRQMNGEPSQTFPHIRGLERKLREEFPGVAVTLHDERFTSVMASRAIIEGGVKKQKRQQKGIVDRVSAAIILQSYLDGARGGVK